MMTRSNHFRVIALGCSLPVLLGQIPAQAATPEAVIATNVNTPVATLSSARLKRVFSGRQTDWSAGVPVIIVWLPKGSTEMTWLCKNILGMPEEAYRRYVLERVFRGVMRKPVQVKSRAEGQRILAERKGAIGPLLKAKLTPSIKTIAVK